MSPFCVHMHVREDIPDDAGPVLFFFSSYIFGLFIMLSHPAWLTLRLPNGQTQSTLTRGI
jgi:hypothetical protein